ncbi:LysR substrate-binding domain-containing protein [Arachnia propionica]|uniref:LysR substrate-binding domain-containing protein n=1 Tax=Arachnia propionica TaxID=1750 RepID=UPI00163A7C87|nr:LysR substrate-binding domain-containing protein [Arachnia propionica]MDO5082885.1 LysR substrate-binding domain-containing protein [Arachnia propionica]
MELQQMRYAIAVAEERSFTKAAERCFVVQSALSHQIKALERELGVQLFARTSRRVELTPAGEAFVAAAREALQATERAMVDAAAAEGEVRGTLTLGVIPTVTAVDVPHVLAAFHAAHPAVRVRLRGGGSEQFISDIRAGQLDVAFLGLAESTPPQGVAFHELSHEALVAALPANHHLARRKRVKLEELADETFVDFPSGSAGRAQGDLAFEAAELQREVAFEAMTTDLILGLIRNELAVGILSAQVIPHDPGVVAVPLVDGPRRIEYLAWNDFNPSPATRAFLEATPIRSRR